MIGGSTPLLDGVSLAVDEMRNSRYDRKPLIIISDGEDNTSRCTLRTLKEKLSGEDVLTYAIGLMGPPPMKWLPANSGTALLSDITKETGGRVFEGNETKELRQTAARIGKLIRNIRAGL
jgi:Ca-activated chloride channel family protein